MLCISIGHSAVENREEKNIYKYQGLIQKEKVDIDGEKAAQISIVAKKEWNLNTPKLVCTKSVHWCQKQPGLTVSLSIYMLPGVSSFELSIFFANFLPQIISSFNKVNKNSQRCI